MPNFTKPQQDAISARTGPLLVSAAAGSGKTTVLVERAIGLILDDANPVPADRLLIVTYTNAAAAEMKHRIAARLSELSRERPDDMRLIRASTLIAMASIGTIHSFCLDLIRQNFQHLPISQDFKVADEAELAVVRAECAASVIEQFYTQRSPAFLSLVELLSTARDDSRLTETLLRLYAFARSHPFYHTWLDRVEALYHAPPPVEQTLWGKSILAYARSTLEHCDAATTALLPLLEDDPAALRAYGSPLRQDIAEYTRCLGALDTGDWDVAVNAIAEFDYTKLAPLRGSDAIKSRVQTTRTRCKKLVRDLRDKTLCASGADFAADMADLAPKVTALFDLTRAFDAAFTAHKRRKKRLDFADLEHLALGLLIKPDADGNYIRTEQSDELSSRYGAVLIDEYQDVNEVQDLIFTSVSDRERNLFLVGDAKQSIYSFRLATPAIFLARKATAFPYESGISPAKIILGENFRSRAQVTGAVNYIFSRLMSEDIGDIAYTADERLIAAATYPNNTQAQSEFLLIDNKSGEEDNADEYEDTSAAEAACVALKISRMLADRYPVTDSVTKEIRPARPGDFCILLRSPKGRLQTYLKALESAGLPAWAQSGDGFLSLREVAMITSLLEALDSPLRDIPLAAALISPLFGFTAGDLAAIRLKAHGVPFYRALQCASQGEGTLAARCKEFLLTFRLLRERAALLSADKLLLEIYTRTDALAITSALPLGGVRRANLLLLAEYAASYHQMGYKGLSGFVGILSRLRERGADLAPATLSGEGSGAVRVMSVHRSKGLEFPIVIFAGAAKKFNLQDLVQNTQLHSEYGFACVRREPESMKQYPTLPMQAIRQEKLRGILSEELRILYVALTRAKEKLIITAAPGGNLGKKLQSLAGELTDGKLSPRWAEQARSPSDWLLMSLLHHPNGAPLREIAGLHDLAPVTDPTPWHIEIIAPPAKREQTAEVEIIPPRTATPDAQMLATLQERLSWRYSYAANTTLPAKLAVSALSHREDGDAYRFCARPRFMGERILTPAERGNALHKFMQFADYARARENPADEAARMSKMGFLTPAEAESLDLGRLRTFFGSPLAGRIFAADSVLREVRLLAKAGQDVLREHLPGMDSQAEIALQGVADCVFIKDGAATLLDYKTDSVKSADDLAARYALQLHLYRHILSDSLPVPIRECLLYSFHLGRAISVYG